MAVDSVQHTGPEKRVFDGELQRRDGFAFTLSVGGEPPEDNLTLACNRVNASLFSPEPRHHVFTADYAMDAEGLMLDKLLSIAGSGKSLSAEVVFVGPHGCGRTRARYGDAEVTEVRLGGNYADDGVASIHVRFKASHAVVEYVPPTAEEVAEAARTHKAWEAARKNLLFPINGESVQ